LEGLIQLLGEILAYLGTGLRLLAPLAVLLLLGLVLFAKARRLARWLLFLGFGLVALALGGLTVLNAFFFEPSMRWILDRVADRTGIEVQYGEVDGDLWAGQISFADLSARRAQDPVSQLDFRLARARVDIAVTSLLWGEIDLEEVHLRGLRGSYQRVGSAEPAGPRRDFRIRRLRLQDVQIEVLDAREEPAQRISIEIASLESADFSARQAVFDLLFRSQIQGRFQGVAFQIESTPDDPGGRSRWRVTGARPGTLGVRSWPAALASASLDLDVQSRWQPDPGSDVDFRIGLALSGVVRPQDEILGRAYDLLLDADQTLRLTLPLRLAQSRFTSARSVSDTGVVGALLDQVGQSWDRLSNGLDLSDAPGLLEEAGEGARDLWDRITDR
jgi:hypothetical protein